MNKSELSQVIDWAHKEGWNPGLYDAETFWETDPNGFFAIDVAGKMVGSIAAISYGGTFGYIGLLIVMPEWRKKGLGNQLFDIYHSLNARLNNDASIGLDGVFNMQDYYAKNGFVFSHRNLRMEGKGKRWNYDQQMVLPIYKSDFDAIAVIDQQCFGFKRDDFLRKWLDMPKAVSLKYLSSQKIEGYGVMRKCRQGWKIGPLFANNIHAAEELFKALFSKSDGESVYLDVPEINQAAMQLAKKYNLKESFACARMYHGNAPILPYENIFGITTFELG
jgi:GNAT superfamily N-acetyltransferase